MIKRKQKINESEVLKFGFLGGIGQAIYILFVNLSIMIMERAMPPYPPRLWGPVLVLMLFVFSAGVSAILIFGYPAYLFVQKRYAEGLMTAVTSLLTLAIIGILVFMLLSVVY